MTYGRHFMIYYSKYITDFSFNVVKMDKGEERGHFPSSPVGVSLVSEGRLEEDVILLLLSFHCRSLLADSFIIPSVQLTVAVTDYWSSKTHELVPPSFSFLLLSSCQRKEVM